MIPLNKSYKNRKVSLTIHCKYKYLDSTAQRAEDRRQKFAVCRLPFAVNVKLNLSIGVLTGGYFMPRAPRSCWRFARALVYRAGPAYPPVLQAR